MKKFLAAGTLAVGLSFGFGGAADAGEICYVTKKVTTYETISVTEYRTVPYDACVTRYDHCGVPYTAHVTLYRTVAVKVVKQVPVVKYVQVPVSY